MKTKDIIGTAALGIFILFISWVMFELAPSTKSPAPPIRSDDVTDSLHWRVSDSGYSVKYFCDSINWKYKYDSLLNIKK